MTQSISRNKQSALDQATIVGVIGLGYVGLPLAIEFSKHYQVVGFDINTQRISELHDGYDRTKELSPRNLAQLKLFEQTFEPHALKKCNIYIVTVPTPVNEHKIPELNPLIEACSLVASVLDKGDLVIFESTVYPGLTTEFCVPLIENKSGLKHNKDFTTGYSPERINPGDKEHSLDKVIKLVSGSNDRARAKVTELYKKIAISGVYTTETIAIAEAAKVIENIQRDVNIALINELTKIFDKMGLPISQILEAARTKWNFIDFRPGMVGGHCIGIDPYYLMHACNAIGQHPEIISAARRINDSMPAYWANEFVKKLSMEALINPASTNKILLMGATFKENCPDVRNTKVFEFAKIVENYGYQVQIYDPHADLPDQHPDKFRMISELKKNYYGAVALLVPHDEFIELGYRYIKDLCIDGGFVYDHKNVF